MTTVMLYGTRWTGSPFRYWSPLSGQWEEWFRPWRWSGEHPTETELYRLRNPIVEEDGVKMMKLQFDVRRFK